MTTKQRFLASLAATRATSEPVWEFGDRMTGTRQEMLRWQERQIRRIRRDRNGRAVPLEFRRPRSRERRLTRSSRGPPDDDAGRPSNNESDPPLDDDAEAVS